MRTPHTYNATAITRDAAGAVISLEMVQLLDGRVCRANGHWSHANGTDAYHAGWLRGCRGFDSVRVDVHLDDGAAYKRGIRESFARVGASVGAPDASFEL